jgi:hypothetical protein
MNNYEKLKHKIEFCPSCGHSLLDPKSLLNMFSVAQDTAYFCWCSNCTWRGEIVEVVRITAPDLASN